MKDICDFLGIDYSDDLLHLDNHNSSFEGSAPGIFTTSVGRWRQALSPEAVWWAQKLGNDNMLRLDYEPAPCRPNYARLILDIITLPSTLLRALRANRQHRGPTLQYLRRRLSGLFSK